MSEPAPRGHGNLVEENYSQCILMDKSGVGITAGPWGAVCKQAEATSFEGWLQKRKAGQEMLFLLLTRPFRVLPVQKARMPSAPCRPWLLRTHPQAICRLQRRSWRAPQPFLLTLTPAMTDEERSDLHIC